MLVGGSNIKAFACNCQHPKTIFYRYTSYILEMEKGGGGHEEDEDGDDNGGDNKTYNSKLPQ